MRYKFIIEYDGSDFYGWQRQPSVRTVEEELETALGKLYQQPVDLIGQGRTDKGVHAKAQVAHADLPDHFQPKRIAHALKGLLPKDIVVHTVEVCPDDFHARFVASARRYSYHITTRPAAIYRNYRWYCYLVPDPEILNVCAEKILGTHDFMNFCIPSQNEMQTTLCTVTESQWVMSDHGVSLTYYITANRFLRHMVRRIVGSLILTASGKMSMNEFASLFGETEREQKGHSAPAEGLILEEVYYE